MAWKGNKAIGPVRFGAAGPFRRIGTRKWMRIRRFIVFVSALIAILLLWTTCRFARGGAAEPMDSSLPVPHHDQAEQSGVSSIQKDKPPEKDIATTSTPPNEPKRNGPLSVANESPEDDEKPHAPDSEMLKISLKEEPIPIAVNSSPSPTRPRKYYRMLDTNFKYSPAASIPWEILDQLPPDPPPNEVGGNDYGGFYDGTKFKLNKQSFPYNLLFTVVVTKEEAAKSINGQVPYVPWTANIWSLFTVLAKKGWSFTLDEALNPTLYISRSEGPRINERHQMANSIGKFSCLAGNKFQQLQCRKEFADMHGCDFDDLNISPAQYSLQVKEECERFFAKADSEEQRNKVFLLKAIGTEHGDGIHIFHGPDGLRKRFQNCRNKPYIIMDYVDKPALVNDRKVDLRTFILVASLAPKLVFYHEGYSRVTSQPYSRNSTDPVVHISNARNQSMFFERFLNHSQLAWKLEQQHPGFDASKFTTYVKRRAKAVSRFVIESAMAETRHTRGRFHLFAVDWAIDENGRLGLLEVNSAPLIAQFPWIMITPKIWEDYIDLVMKIHIDPKSLPLDKMLVKEGFKYGGWELIFNELEAWYDRVHGKPYNACRVFLEEDRWDV